MVFMQYKLITLIKIINTHNKWKQNSCANIM